MKETTTRKTPQVIPKTKIETKYEEFEDFMRRLVAVPKSEIDKRMAKEKKAKVSKRRKSNNAV